jgi:hypothetical protein
MRINNANNTKSPAQLAMVSTTAVPTEVVLNTKPYAAGNSARTIDGAIAETLHLLDVVAVSQTTQAVAFFISK